MIKGVKPFRSKFHFSFFIFHSSFFILLLLLSSCKDIRREYHPNGQLKQQLSYKNNQLDGPCTWYYANGNKMMECVYDKGMIEGKLSRWYFNGKPESEGTYVHNRQNGSSTLYFEKGGVNIEQHFTNDTLNGPYTEYHPNAQIKTKGRYDMGLWDGHWEYFDDIGMPVGEADFAKGTGVLKGYYRNGRLMREVHYTNNQKNGTETWYKENGLVEKELFFEQDKLVKE